MTSHSQAADAPTQPSMFRLNSRLVLPIMLIIPVQLFLLGMLVFPFLLELWISLTNWQPTLGTLADSSFIGLLNFEELLLYETRFTDALLRTLTFSVICLSAEFLIGLGLAVVFLKTFRGRRAAFAVLLSPMMIMPVVVGYTWFMLFQVNGPINQIIGWITFSGAEIEWFRNGTLAFIAICVAEIWHWTPLFFLILLSGLQAVPENPVRAAVVLGASNLRIFLTIVLPTMLPVIIVAFVIRSMEIVKIFDEIFLMTRGGPGTATETISLYLYKLAFQDFRTSYAAAAAFVVLVITVVLINLMLRPIRYQLLESS